STFVQDDFKIHPQLTLNLGVRWELNGGMSEVRGWLTNVWPSLALAAGDPPTEGTLVGWTVPPNYPESQFPIPANKGVFRRKTKSAARSDLPLHNWGPRLGLAWKPFRGTDRFVVRTGYGIFYNRTQGNAILQLSSQAPFVSTFSFSGQANA